MRNKHPTKRGPGRVHASVPHGAPPAAPKGAPVGFVQRTRPLANERRKAKAAIGARQFRKQCKAAAREAKSGESL